ncbi:hypothetical protein HAX54_004134 [Datura stramonium]|uniref:Uncharacterized protein n=1 Tax=Datura stramonium TaxID=4076 RepID=A0ABS8WXK1_DATST|nr:hypothetical protein [Datura stramonium]
MDFDASPSLPGPLLALEHEVESVPEGLVSGSSLFEKGLPKGQDQTSPIFALEDQIIVQSLTQMAQGGQSVISGLIFAQEKCNAEVERLTGLLVQWDAEIMHLKAALLKALATPIEERGPMNALRQENDTLKAKVWDPETTVGT